MSLTETQLKSKEIQRKMIDIVSDHSKKMNMYEKELQNKNQNLKKYDNSD